MLRPSQLRCAGALLLALIAVGCSGRSTSVLPGGSTDGGGGAKRSLFTALAPTDISGLSVWLDAADSTKIVQSGGKVSQWTDKGPNGANAVNTVSTEQPTVVPYAYNGLSALHFTTASQQYLLSQIPQSGAATWFVVYQQDTAMDAMPFFARFNDGMNYMGAISPAYFGVATLATGGFTPHPAGPSILVNGASSSAFPIGSLNILGSTWSSGIPSGTYKIPIGADAYEHGRFLQGSVAEVVSYNRVLSTTERQEVEGYLACKWGLQTSLPSGHPYSSTCPTNLGPAVFLPSQFGSLNVWLDGADASSIVQSGGSVSQWTDKGPAGANAVNGVTAEQPTVVANAYNGHSALQFATSSQQFLMSNVPQNGPASWFVVYQQDTAMDAMPFFARYNDGNNSMGAISPAYFGIATTAVGGFTPHPTGPTILVNGATTSAFPIGSLSILGSTWTGGITNGTYKIPFGADVYEHGRFLQGKIAEIVSYNRVLTTGERQEVEGYLACKWGLQASLPSGHPYGSACPPGWTAGPSPTPGPTPNGSLYVANEGDGSFLSYAAGNYSSPTTTVTTLVGSSTSNQIRLDASGNTWIASPTALYEFASGANALATPLRTITLASPPVGFARFYAVAVDSAGTIYATDGTTIYAFASTASGSSTPARTITGSSTTLTGANLLATDASGDLWVGDDTSADLVEFSPTANGNVAPTATLYGAAAAVSCALPADSAEGLTIDSSGDVLLKLELAATPSIPNLLEYAPGSQSTGDCPTARGNLQYGEGDIGVDSSGYLYVLNSTSGLDILSMSSVFAAFPSGYASPYETITGSGSGLNFPGSLAVAP